MEKQLFTWTGWDQFDTMDFGFYDVKLIQGIGEEGTPQYVPEGTEYKYAHMDLESGTCDFYSNGSTRDLYNGSNEEPVLKIKLELKCTIV